MKDEMVKIAAIITTLDETNGSPESMLYIFYDMDINKWTSVRNTLIEAKLITIKGNYVTLTEIGKETARKLNQALTK